MAAAFGAPNYGTGKIHMWNITDRTSAWTADLNKSVHAEGLVFSRDGSLLASGGRNGSQIWFWDTSNGSLKYTLDQQEEVVSLDFLPDGTGLASGALDGSVWLWRVRP